MIFKIFFIRYLNLILFCSTFLLSCTNEFSDVKEIDFNKNNTESNAHLKSTEEGLSVAISAMVSPNETFNQYQDLIAYISQKVKIPITFKQRKTYSEVNELLRKGDVDFAFICTGAYKEAKKSFPIELLVVPVINNEPFYQAYVIVNNDSKINSIEGLKGRSFAFTDPISNSGCNYIVNYLKEKNTTPKDFFSKTIFTNAHDNSLQVVSKKIVDGATIDGLIFDYYAKHNPERISHLKIIKKSQKFGIPPFVINPKLSPDIKNKLRQTFLNMNRTIEGKKILSQLMIDKFIIPDIKNYNE